MEENVARLVAAVGVLIWGVLAVVSLILERRYPEIGSPEATSPSPSSEPPHSRAV
jgi:hypothetical protein